MKKYIICLLASTSILSAADLDGYQAIPNLAAANQHNTDLAELRTPREQAETVIAAQLNQISTTIGTYSPAETKILELAMKVENLSGQATAIIQQKLGQHTRTSATYDAKLLELALAIPALNAQATGFIEFKLGQYTYFPDMHGQATVDTSIFKLARGIPSLSNLMEKLARAKISKYRKAAETTAPTCLPADLPVILESVMHNPLFSSQAINIIEKEIARYESSSVAPDLRMIKLALINQHVRMLKRNCEAEEKELGKKLSELNSKAIDFIDNQLGRYIYAPTSLSMPNMYDSYIIKLAIYHETLRPMALRFISDELTRMSTSTITHLSPQSIDILRLATTRYTIGTQPTAEEIEFSDKAANIIRTQLGIVSSPTMLNHETLRLAFKNPALKDQATDIIRSKLATLTNTTTMMSLSDIAILELAMEITN